MELSLSSYSKVPFEEKGRSLAGWDCWGVVYVLYKILRGIDLPSYVGDYLSTADAREVAKLINNEKGDWEKVDKPAIFDVVILRLKNNPMHCGMYIGEGRFIHCLKGTGTSVERLKSIVWRDRIVEYRRYRESN